VLNSVKISRRKDRVNEVNPGDQMLYSVQLLRAAAAVLVVICHAIHKQGQLSGTGAIWAFGGSGVDLFFIISGFIMCHVTARKQASAAQFLWARVLRIMPLYWILSLVALGVFVVDPAIVNSSGGTTTILNSFTLFPTSDKFLIQTGWTLSYEFIFYFIFAASLFFDRVNRLLFIAASIVLVVGAGALTSPSNPTIRFVTDPLLLEFLMGVGAYLYVLRAGSHTVASGALLLVGSAMLACVAYVNYSHYRVIVYGIPYMIFFAGLVSFERLMRSAACHAIGRAIGLLGDASYSTYLSHPFALAAVGIILKRLHIHNLGLASTFILVIASLGAGLACYFALERPLTRWVGMVFGRSPAAVTSPLS
jgi:peptidoglycan/LPS O-acetylase OafA/YrhL